MDLRTTRTIGSAIEIRAPLDSVWDVLTDFSAYPEWNPHIRRVRGTPRAGGRLTIRSEPPTGRPVVLRPMVTNWTPPTELRWRGTFLSRFLFSGEHGFKLEPIAEDRVRFVQDETFTGLLVPLYARLRLHKTRDGFNQMSEALRERVEGRTGTQSTESAPAEVAVG